MRLPLTNWQLHAAQLPERLLDAPCASGFKLPGADALGDFADLLGEDAGTSVSVKASPETAPFALPALLPEDIDGPVSLTREIDFGALTGDRAVLEFGHLLGRGEILLGKRVVARFNSARPLAPSLAAAAALTAAPCMLAVDLTNALHLGRCETLTLRFDKTRPAGACGPVFLNTTARASLAHASIAPDAHHRTITLRVRITAQTPGRYVLRAQAVSPDADEQAAPARETTLSLTAGEARDVSFSMEVAAGRFVPRKVYAPVAVKLQLFFRAESARGDGVPCDSAMLMCGYPVRSACAYLPLAPRDCTGDPRLLVERLTALHVPAVSLPAPATDSVYRALCRAGIAVRQFVPADSPLRVPLARYPNVWLDDQPLEDRPYAPEVVAWRLCGTVAFPRALDETLTPDELLLEAAGRPLDPDDEGVQRVLAWLGAVSVRLHAEAARQNRFLGPLCAPDALQNPDAADALRSAFAPLHLSALPLCGAWWTDAQFSAVLAVFIPEDEDRTFAATAALEDENGRVLARMGKSCTKSGEIGVLKFRLPAQPCVLTLTCTLTVNDETVEESALPVYVGTRGPLEAAFR